MEKMKKLAEEIISGRRLKSHEECQDFVTANLEDLMDGADRIRKALCGNHADLCSIINGRSGRCSENCKFCAQSGCNKTGIQEYPFIALDPVIADCHKYENYGVDRYSIVTAGKNLRGTDLEKAIAAYQTLHRLFPKMKLCASHGELSDDALRRMKEAGVTMVHCNIETSRRFFPEICTSHTYDDKLREIARIKKAGLQVCCGGIIGMGETWEDRIDMALSISGLGVLSIPLNALIPIKGTPLENRPIISNEDVIRTVALFRYINPQSQIRIAAGRFRFADGGACLFRAGANAAITGEMLTTGGNNTAEDRTMLKDIGFQLRKPATIPQ